MGWIGRKSSSEAKQNRRRRGRVAVFVGLIAASAVVFQASHAAFTGTTDNRTNSLSAGTVTITDNRAGVAMFTASSLAPGATGQYCIGVSYTGSITPSAIKMYFANPMESNAGAAYTTWANNTTSAMDNNTTMRVEVNDTDLASDPGVNNCTPTGYGAYVSGNVTPATAMNTLIDTNKTFATGLPTWNTVTRNTWRVFRFTYTLDANAPDAAQGDGVQFDVVWEAHS
ncbi:hypothetical protein [Paractinoplanes lichenicola]|uniref:Uncharacterized protein n=1 Tax=Paractinoplanes lichenicola TaxID=2802976 RepID=A0ABS1W370_9ACTN|nr:hypothetical protein [Actinoplanes lichenicola]MBL7261157.1 hypothetical protein [Actinoplanes lichenicola]